MSLLNLILTPLCPTALHLSTVLTVLFELVYRIVNGINSCIAKNAHLALIPVKKDVYVALTAVHATMSFVGLVLIRNHVTNVFQELRTLSGVFASQVYSMTHQSVNVYHAVLIAHLANMAR